MDKHERLRFARIAAGFKTAKEAAARLGVPYGTYSGHESGSRGIKDAELRAYSQTFKASVSWLATGEGDMPQLSEISRRIVRKEGLDAFKIETEDDILPPPQPLRKVPYPEFTDDRIPVLGKAMGGDDGKFLFNGDPIDYVARPPQLQGVRSAYGVYVDGESMEPRYFAGELVYIHPDRPARANDFVVAELHPEQPGGESCGLIKQFKRWAGNTLILWQYNPPKEIKIDRQKIKGLHLIVFAGGRD